MDSNRWLNDITNFLVEETEEKTNLSKSPARYDISKGFLTQFECENFLRKLFQFRELEKIGRGCFGTVYRVIRPGYACAEACKIINYLEARGQLANQSDPSAVRYFSLEHRGFLQEVSLLRDVSHQNIISYNDTYQLYHNSVDQSLTIAKGSSWIGVGSKQTLLLSACLMDLAEISLTNWLENHSSNINRLNEHLLRALFMQIGGALSYLHTRHSICHHDLKEDNIVLKRDFMPDDASTACFKLIDFGISARYPEKTYEIARKIAEQYDVDGNCRAASPITDKGNPFIREGNCFGKLLYELFSTITDKWLKAVIAVLSSPDFSGNDIEKVTVEWALSRYAESENGFVKCSKF